MIPAFFSVLFRVFDAFYIQPTPFPRAFRATCEVCAMSLQDLGLARLFPVVFRDPTGFKKKSWQPIGERIDWMGKHCNKLRFYYEMFSLTSTSSETTMTIPVAWALALNCHLLEWNSVDPKKLNSQRPQHSTNQGPGTARWHEYVDSVNSRIIVISFHTAGLKKSSAIPITHRLHVCYIW